MFKIPVTQLGETTVEVTLDGVTYSVVTKINTRNKRLYFSVFLLGVEVFSGVRMIENTNLVRQYQMVNKPLGDFNVSQFKDSKVFATLGNTGLDKEYCLCYFPEEDVREV